MNQTVSGAFFKSFDFCCCLALFAVLAVGATTSPIACDFILPSFQMNTLLPYYNHYPPFPVVSAPSRYLWSCRSPNDLRGNSQFSVDLHANLEISGMLALVEHGNSSLGTQIILTDFLGDESNLEWEVEASLLFSGVPESAAALPKLGLRFRTSTCGCVKRVRFNWDGGETSENGSCEASINVHSESGDTDNSCFPSWAFHNFDPIKQRTEIREPLLSGEVQNLNPCHPVLWDTVPLPQKALRSASFNGYCR